MFSFTKIAGKGYITLNIIRVLNIISLLLVAVASWIMIVVPAMNGDFNFFDATSHFITSTVSTFLIVSEVNLFQNYFARDWPMLGADHGFTFLGMTMIVLGINILGNLNKSPTTEAKLGMAMWRVAISAGILSLTIGVLNIISSIIFRDRKQHITARQVRSHGAVAPSVANSAKAFSTSSGSLRRSDSLPTHNVVTGDRRKSRFGIKLPIRMSGISKPVAHNPEQFSKWNERSSPVVPDVQRPPTALHPAYNYQAPPVPAPSSRYSEVSDMTRF